MGNHPGHPMHHHSNLSNQTDPSLSNQTDPNLGNQTDPNLGNQTNLNVSPNTSSNITHNDSDPAAQTVPQTAPVTTLPISIPTQVRPAVYKKSNYIHPFIELINRNAPEDEIIGTLSVFMSSIPLGTDDKGRPIYEAVDQLAFLVPVTQVFAYAANNGKKNLTKWLMDNFVPLRVSEDNNFCYFESLKWNHAEIADMIASHESFVPTMTTLESLMSRNRYDVFKKCMRSPHLTGDMQKYRFTFSSYIDNQKYHDVSNLLLKIKNKENGRDVQITDPILPDPRIAMRIAQAAPIVPLIITPSVETPSVENPVETPVISPNAAPIVVTNVTYQDPFKELEKVAETNPIPATWIKELTGGDVVYVRPSTDTPTSIPDTTPVTDSTPSKN